MPRNSKDLNKEENYAILLRQEQFFLILTSGGMLLSVNNTSKIVPEWTLNLKSTNKLTEGFEDVGVMKKANFGGFLPQKIRKSKMSVLK